MNGLNNGAPLVVTPYPVAWRIERAQDDIYRGFEHVRWERTPPIMVGYIVDTHASDFTGDLRKLSGIYGGAARTTVHQ